MRAVDIIARKRDGLELTAEEIQWFIEHYTQGDLPDYQAAAFLMAVCIRGMSRQEISDLTLAMAHSGEVLNLSRILGGYAVDKHSSGGVGDKTTLVVLPLVASCGVPVAKMSGRGLGFSGGTLDKLEAIHGFNVNLSTDTFEKLAQEYGIVLAGQSKDLAPADGKLYALRDVTATVPSLPLIASSIMSKKLAAGANGIVLDVKVGEGAFMTNLDDARMLAQMMVEIGADAGRDVVALISDMNQPLGEAVGNAIEMAEALETLHGGGPDDLREHCLTIARHMVQLAGQGQKWTDDDEVNTLLRKHLDEGQALATFRRMVQAQGGDIAMVDDPTRLPRAAHIETVYAEQSGFVAHVAALKVATAAFDLGAGREKKEDTIDLAVGIQVHVKVGDSVQAGDPIATIHASSAEKLQRCRDYLTAEAFTFAAHPVERLPLFYDLLSSR